MTDYKGRCGVVSIMGAIMRLMLKYGRGPLWLLGNGRYSFVAHQPYPQPLLNPIGPCLRLTGLFPQLPTISTRLQSGTPLVATYRYLVNARTFG
jgi:hypothetical protein